MGRRTVSSPPPSPARRQPRNQSTTQNNQDSEFFQFPNSEQLSANNVVRSPTPTSTARQEHPARSSGSGSRQQRSPSQPMDVQLPVATRTLIRVIQADGAKFPAFVPSASKNITKTFKQKQDEQAISSKLVPKGLKEHYWREFEKACTWEPGYESIVRGAWNRIAAKRYSDWQYKLKRRVKKPTWCGAKVWIAWKKSWDSAESKAKGAIKSANRRGNSGKKPSVHLGGSKSHLEHALAICRKEGAMPSLLRQFRLMHKKGDKFCDEKSSEINVALEKKMLEKVAEAELAGLPASSVDEDRVFLDVLDELGFLGKGRIYGIGNRASSVSTDGSFSSTAGTPTQPAWTEDKATELVRRIIQENYHESVQSLIRSSVPHIVEIVLSQINQRGSQPTRPAACEDGQEESSSDSDSDNDNGDDEDVVMTSRVVV